MDFDCPRESHLRLKIKGKRENNQINENNRNSFSERLLSVTAKDEYKLQADEMWPEEVAHLFDKVEQGKPTNLKG